MKTVVLFRHGKSDRDADYHADSERPLSKRGRNAAKMMGAFLSRLDQRPDRVLTSPAVRAHETVTLAARSGGWSCPVDIVPDFYSGDPGIVLNHVRKQNDTASSLLLAGHEPTWSALAAGLIDGGKLRFPTAAMARIDFDVDNWIAVEPGAGELIWFLIPRLVQATGFEAATYSSPSR